MTPDAEADDEALLAHLAALEAELHHPGSGCTRERLEVLLHPQFDEVGRSGAPWSREQVLGYLQRQEAPPPVVPFGHRLVRLAEDVALLTYVSGERAVGAPPVHGARRSSVWLRTAAGWQLRYHQGTPAVLAPGEAA